MLRILRIRIRDTASSLNIYFTVILYNYRSSFLCHISPLSFPFFVCILEGWVYFKIYILYLYTVYTLLGNQKICSIVHVYCVCRYLLWKDT
jgi:hypothetical protein